jgi:hypothetical protein
MPPSPSSKKRSAETTEDPTVDPPRPNGPRKIVEVIPDADFLLKVGDGADALDIKASSVILKASSKHFKAMLDSPCIEATRKFAELKEDNPQAILDFCYITHHRADDVGKVNASRLRGLMDATDVLDCQHAIKPWMLSILGEFITWVNTVSANPTDQHELPSSIPGWTMEDGITFAAAFGMRVLFWKVTRVYLAVSTPKAQFLADAQEETPQAGEDRDGKDVDHYPLALLPIAATRSGDLTIQGLFPDYK